MLWTHTAFGEPLSNLDAELRVGKRMEIARQHKEIGAMMIYVTHDQVEAMTLADEIVALRDGCIQQVGAPVVLYRIPDNKFVAGFIGSPAMNFMDGRIDDGLVAVKGLNDRLKPPLSLPETGTPTWLGIRPEQVEIDQSGDTHVVEPTGCCQTNANQSQFSSKPNRLSRAEVAPLGKSGDTVQLEI